jgi:hypothetical protein
MFATWPVAFFAGDAQYKAGSAVSIGWGRNRLEVSCVTVQTTRNYRTIKIREAIPVSRAVYPAQFCPVGNRKLKKLITCPKQISLPLASRSYNEGNFFRSLRDVRCYSLACSLKKAILLLVHPEK